MSKLYGLNILHVWLWSKVIFAAFVGSDFFSVEFYLFSKNGTISEIWIILKDTESKWKIFRLSL